MPGDEGEARHAEHMQPHAGDLDVIRRREHCAMPVSVDTSCPLAHVPNQIDDADELVAAWLA